MPAPTSSLETILTRAWLRRGWLACALFPLSWVFGLLGGLRRRLYAAGWLPSTRLPVPVIVAGNIFIGGTGKTPLTIWLVNALREAGYTPGVISRGYGAHSATPRSVHPDSLPQEVGDEPLLIAQHAACPVWVGRRRAAAAQALLAANPNVDVIVSDDGLQHYALQRDIEIVLFDGRGTGNGWLLPAGPLREPPSRRRDFTVVNAAGSLSGLTDAAIYMRLETCHAQRLLDRSQTLALTSLAQPGADGQQLKLVAAAGIGNPARFFASLYAAGLQFTEMPLPDHYDFASNPFAEVAADIILITEKDAVKCSRSNALKNDPRLWVVPVVAQIDHALLDQLLEKLRGRTPA